MNPDYPDPTVPDYSYTDGGLSLAHLGHLMVLGATWLLVLVSAVLGTLVVWSGKDPAGYERYMAAPFRRGWWWLWANASWSRLVKRCGLSDSEQVSRRDREGKRTTVTVWTHPKLLRVKTSDHCMYLTVRTRTGQTVEHLEKAVPAIRDAAGAHSARSVVVAPGTVRMEFVMREHLAGVDHALIPAQVETTSVRLGRSETRLPELVGTRIGKFVV